MIPRCAASTTAAVRQRRRPAAPPSGSAPPIQTQPSPPSPLRTPPPPPPQPSSLSLCMPRSVSASVSCLYVIPRNRNPLRPTRQKEGVDEGVEVERGEPGEKTDHTRIALVVASNVRRTTGGPSFDPIRGIGMPKVRPGTTAALSAMACCDTIEHNAIQSSRT
jgi:hypothetical protein